MILCLPVSRGSVLDRGGLGGRLAGVSQRRGERRGLNTLKSYNP